MLVRLTRDMRIPHKAGETVDVSPAHAGFLLSTGSAVILEAPKPETPDAARPETRKRPAARRAAAK